MSYHRINLKRNSTCDIIFLPMKVTSTTYEYADNTLSSFCQINISSLYVEINEVNQKLSHVAVYIHIFVFVFEFVCL